jgi:5-formyltetrahydrofolate cyclo-ligase
MKKTLRQKLYRKRSQAFQEDQDTGAAAALKLISMADPLFDQFLSSGQDLQSKVIAGYIPIGSEIDPRPLLNIFHEKGARLCMPEVMALDEPLKFREWKPGDLLISGALGTLQPLSTAAMLTPDMMLLPLVGVDQEGVRMGQGGGFYDRTIAHNRKKDLLKIGLAFDAQMVDELPRETHDEYLDGLITPSLCKLWDEDRQARYLKQA